MWVRDQAVLVRDEGGRPMYWQGASSSTSPGRSASRRRSGRVRNVTASSRRPLPTSSS
ncbi:MAG: hypothetical protein ACR2HO_02245 [Rubrobacteraceae bacterium]